MTKGHTETVKEVLQQINKVRMRLNMAKCVLMDHSVAGTKSELYVSTRTQKPGQVKLR